MGKSKNMGNVGSTYQKVYQAWLAIFSDGCFSTYNQIMAKIVTVGKATISAPSLSFRFASSDAATMTVAVIKYLVISQPI